MDDYTEEEQAEYEALVKRELMLLRAKKEAADLFRREEEARRMKEIEEELERQKQKDIRFAESLTDMGKNSMKEWIAKLKNAKSESAEKYAITLEQCQRELKRITSYVNRCRAKAGLDPVDYYAEVPEEYRAGGDS